MMNPIEHIAIGLDNYAKSWRSFVNTEITDKTRFSDVSESLKVAFNKDYNNEQVAVEVALCYYSAEKFLCYKTIYRFEPGFLSLVSQTEDTVIHLASLKNLPVKCFLVALDSQAYYGLSINVDLYETDILLNVVLFPSGNIESTPSKILQLTIQDGQTISEAILVHHQFKEESGTVGENLITDEETIKILSLATQIVYYLSAQNREIKKINIPKEKRPLRTNGTPLNIRHWSVGYRIGNEFSPAKEKGSNLSISTGTATHGTSPRPHLRRAHFHHYWVGSGEEKKCVLRWIEPVWVSGNSETIIPTEHKVIT